MHHDMGKVTYIPYPCKNYPRCIPQRVPTHVTVLVDIEGEVMPHSYHHLLEEGTCEQPLPQHNWVVPCIAKGVGAVKIG